MKVLTVGLIVSAAIISHALSLSSPIREEFEPWQGMVASVNYEKRECSNTEMGFDIHVVITKDLPDRTLSMWIPSRNEMLFLPTQRNIDSVAHEVHHMTQTMDRRYKSNDQEELLAYMQGAMTNCVYNLIKHE